LIYADSLTLVKLQKEKAWLLKFLLIYPSKISINLWSFSTKLGFSFDTQFTDDTATCMIVSENIFVMLLTHDK